MTALPRLRTFVLTILAALFLVACKSPEEQADQFYQSGLSLLAEGKVEQARLEFQNALQYLPEHEGARLAFADALLAEGKVSDAYIQYVRYVEYRPDSPDIRRKLAGMAILAGNWDEAERHGREALRLEPDAPGAASIRVALEYRAAITGDLASVDATRAALYDAAAALVRADPADAIARRVTIDYLMTGPDPMRALPEVEAALQGEPSDYALNGLKAQLLARKGDESALAAQLDRMVTLFPDDRDLPATLVQLLLRRGEVDKAEAVVRGRIGDAASDIDGTVTLIRFLDSQRGLDAALAEITRAEAASDGQPAQAAYRGVRALIEFDAGQQEGRLAALEGAIADLPPDLAFRHVLQTGLARMQLALGDVVKARGILDAVILEDRSFADALRLRAGLALDQSRPADAINDLRAALNQNPRDVDALLLLSQAHQAMGDMDLAGNRLAEANEASGNAPGIALQQAAFLADQGRLRPAEAVLAEALRTTPQDLGLSTARVDLLLRAGRVDEAAVETDRIAALPVAGAPAVARQMRVLVLEAEGKGDESLAMLTEIADGPEGSLSMQMTLAEKLAAAGRVDDALAQVAKAGARYPEEPQLTALSARLKLQSGQVAEAETSLTALLADDPAFLPALAPLVDHLAATGRADQAEALLRAALAAAPTSAQIRGMLALRLEARGDVDGAITLYRDLLAGGVANPVAANNLASLLVWTRDDEGSLTEAARLSPQIAALPQPAAQDTLGWLAYRQGRYGDAVLALSQAARALPDEALVQYRYARALEAAGRRDEAARQYGQFLSLRGAAPAVQVADAEDRMRKLSPTVP